MGRRLRGVRGAFALGLWLAGCVAAGEEIGAVVEPEPRAPGVAVIPDAGPAPEAGARASDATGEVPRAWALSPDDVLLQIEHAPTFAMVNAVDPSHAYGRVPAVTLYRDGTVIHADASGVMLHRVGERVAARHHAHVLELGIEEVKSHEEDCRPAGDGKTLCMSDASIVILRVRRPDGSLLELRNYGGWALEREAVLHAVYDRLELLKAPPAWGAQPYLPEHATLFLRADQGEHGDDRLEPWPLSPELAERVLAKSELVLAIDAPTIRSLVEALGTNATRGTPFRHGEHVVRVGLVPWLPGTDHPRLERWPE